MLLTGCCQEGPDSLAGRMGERPRRTPKNGASMKQAASCDVFPLTAERWDDFAALMGPKGGYGGCWCMLWRLGKTDFDNGSSGSVGSGGSGGAGAANRRAMKRLARDGPPPGLLAYAGGRAVGWISVAPRRALPRLETSRVLKPVDDREVWSVTCFLIARAHRGRGVAQALLTAACAFVRAQGGAVLEGYPIDPQKRPYPAAYAWTGFKAVFVRAGFEEVARRSPTRPIMRKSLAEG